MEIYINKNGQQLGPFTQAKVSEMLQLGQLSANDFGIKKGQQNWQKLGEMFPQPKQSANIQPINQPNVQLNQQFTPTQKKSGSSKGLLFGLVGCGGLIFLAIIGVIAFTFLSKKSPSEVSDNSDSNISNANTNTKSAVPTDFSGLKNKVAELAKLSPSLKLDANAKLQGKIAIVEKDANSAKLEGFDYDYSKVEDYGLSVYGLTKEQLALTPNEIDSLVIIDCKKGGAVGTYGGKISAFANNCKVSLIDYRKNITFAQKSFVNNKPEKILETTQKSGEYILPMPIAVYDFIKKSVPKITDAEITDASKLPNMTDSKSFADKPSIFGKLKFPVKLDPNAKIKGKIATIQFDSDQEGSIDGGTLVGIDRDGNLHPPLPSAIVLTKESLGFSNDQIAMKPSEIDTLIQVGCKRGSLITKVKGVSVFSNVCTVNVVDYKALAIIDQKTFEGKKYDNDRYSDPSIYDDKKDTVDFPRAEIEEYVKQLHK